MSQLFFNNGDCFILIHKSLWDIKTIKYGFLIYYQWFWWF